MGISATCQLGNSEKRSPSQGYCEKRAVARQAKGRGAPKLLKSNVGRNIEGISSMNIKRERLKSRGKETILIMKAIVGCLLRSGICRDCYLDVITILESSRSGQASADTRSSNSTAPRWRLSLHRPIRANGLVHEQASNWLPRRNLSKCRRTHRPCHFACSASLREGNDRAQVQKPSCDFAAAWIVDLCRFCRARTHPCAPVRVGENQSSSSIAKYPSVLILLFCLSMARLALRPPGSSPRKAATGSLSIQTGIETAVRHLLP